MSIKPIEQIKTDLDAAVGGGITVENTALIVPKEKIQDAARFLKTNPDYQMDYVSCLSGVDYKTHLEVVYHLYSMTKKEGPVVLKTRTDREKSLVPSVTPVWRGAEYQEREAYDLFGIQFEGHPDLRRILMWDGFQHYPMRKDYVQDDQNRDPKDF